jgi:hypothetical protein
MPTPPAQRPSMFGPSVAVAQAGAQNRRSERLLLTAMAVIGTLGLAAWQVPPKLDWSRYKSVIATYASARLGRHVTIGGQVRLTLLPRAMLLADDVTLADRGDGISAKIGTLRLEVSLGGLLTGRIVPRALTIDRPVVSLPWPLPRGTAPVMRPSLGQDFSATMEDGTVLLGGVACRMISARFRTDADTGAFDAQGSAVVAGLPWRFTALVGAPGGDGIAPMTLTLDGQASYSKPMAPGMQGTGGAFHGRILRDGSVAGSLALRGPDASRVGPAPSVPWRASGDVSLSAGTATAPSVDLVVGGSPGRAALVLRLAAPATLSVKASIGTIVGGNWILPLLSQGAGSAPMLATDMELSAAAMTMAGETLRTIHVALSRDAQGTTLRGVSASLPGGGRVQADGRLHGGDAFTGHAHIVAPDLRHVLHWAFNGALDGLPSTLLTNADLQGAVTATGTRVAMTIAAGHVDDSVVGGTWAVGFGRRPALGLDLTLDRISPASWIAPQPPGAGLALGAAARIFSGFDATIHVRSDEVVVPGLVLRHAVFDAEGGREGLRLHEFAADLPGGHVEASGTFGADGALADGRVDLAAPDAALLPAPWRVPEKLWHGGLHVAVNAAGPPQDMAAQMRADLGDLRAEAEAHVDATEPRMAATVTLRHPGAPRLLDDIGLQATQAWLENGSLAVLAHLIVSPGHVQAQDFSVSAAALQVTGGFDADLTGDVPVIDGHVEAGTLALPAVSLDDRSPLPWGLLHGVKAEFRVKAAQVLSGLRPVAETASARFSAAGGDVLIDDVQAGVAGGRLTGQVAIDAARNPPLMTARLAEHGAAADGIGPAGLTISGGPVDVSGDLTAQGYSPWAMVASSAGDWSAIARDISINGLDLVKARALLLAAGPGLRAALPLALTGGVTGGMDGILEGRIADGVMRVVAGRLTGTPGLMRLTGTLDAPQARADLTMSILPAVVAPPTLTVRVAGAWSAPLRQMNVLSGLAWAGQLRKAPAHGTRPGRKR